VRVRVLRLVTRLNVGGPARQALLLSAALAERYPTLLAAGHPAPGEGELSDPAVEVVRVPLVRPVRPTLDLAALAAVRGLLERTQAPILHTHMAKAGAVGRLAARLVSPRPRTVHTFHGHVLDGYFSRPVTRAFLELERRLARHTDVLVAVSPEVRDALVELGVGRPSQYRVLPVGLDLSPYLGVRAPSGSLRAELGLPASVPLLGAVGRLVPIKDHATMLRALGHLPGVHLAVVGDGELRAALEAEAGARGLRDRVHLLGWRTDLPEVLADLDAVVLTSRNEGTPAALIEALAAGRPVVATDVGGVRHVVENGRTGLLVPPGDERAVARALEQVLRDPAFAARLGRAGRDDVARRFGADRLVRATVELYAELAG
jgi:glycosyltransferase involved in cell wall biosynthesis